MAASLSVAGTPIPGLLVVRSPVHVDARGWFKEVWHREKMTALGVPDFGPVQANLSYNARRGATRGIHAEPWDKFVTVATGRVHAAWVDLREGESFGATYDVEIDPSVAVFVPRGVGNAYQALEDGTVYTYLVNDHWRSDRTYPAVNLADSTARIPWPISLDSGEAEISDKDRSNPALGEVSAMAPRRTLILGSGGQLGRALAATFPHATLSDSHKLDLTDRAALAKFPWGDYEVVVNAAAFTAVDEAEEPVGRRAAWALNGSVPAALAEVADRHRLTLVHYSTDYVFDGAFIEGGHREDEAFSPLGVYGQSKAAGDLAVATVARHYILRTSWLIGEGANFVRTMQRLATEGKSPSVVDDQIGRLTFVDELSRATRHLLAVGATPGTYNVTNPGPPMSWAEIARRVFELSGRDPADVVSTTTEEYGSGRRLAPRPRWSVLSLDKLGSTGFTGTDADLALRVYLSAPTAGVP
ncbi:bifunctional dTDP-4-dehydrorhamnose 3,5-epimerase family protein/NAD(P)-dependent oxidoreductase [Nocardioides sp. HM23]|uniref:bifunctional dTDP-4-dehydrorhamnose 3,5-epimerase family protein/NAD(P)-dependent oxidoreductase n=1 Tax=Nocardioides bizhenqiangii TaxID=3095076 RepID=UPI002ACAB79B|nr:bifunctional dTDP-4-dehydrorhamnose 3,5-epimerase family protein/NAD(P)-dependent oxidoreductase [Nocardioides sp. HM23]MDZ5620030.1 bifunctional dTDP-4-dehydrorhamnose 3,5-epimerase family protein/NAD(P)-dependent oxidoreductase [Nocardioides sp. HM23]